MTTTPAIAETLHRGADELPWVDMGDGTRMKVAYVDLSHGIWVVQNEFQAGFAVPTHRHTGTVYGFTLSGAWRYLEYDYINRAGSFLYEPAGSVHTLEVLEDRTVAWFQISGALLYLDAEGNVFHVVDGATALDGYFGLCDAQGIARPSVIVE
jgi:2,4'-dihydroxyacetophenone dioxygenase